MFVMNFVGTPDGGEVTVFTVPEQTEALMNKNIMDEKISKPVNGYAKSYPEKEIVTVLHTKEKADNSRDSEYQEEKIVVLKKAF
jgi:outer membrane lipoprotein-sorting protein